MFLREENKDFNSVSFKITRILKIFVIVNFLNKFLVVSRDSLIILARKHIWMLQFKIFSIYVMNAFKVVILLKQTAIHHWNIKLLNLLFQNEKIFSTCHVIISIVKFKWKIITYQPTPYYQQMNKISIINRSINNFSNI